jgi:hypothetical protein
LEIDPERVAAALPYADPPQVDFRLGGFNVADALDSQRGERARLIRAYNVLRQYEEPDVPPALAAMAAALESGGLLIEGTSNPTGRMVAFDVYRRTLDGLQHDALVFGTNFRAELEPIDFQTILPKRLIHRMLDPIPAAFFAAWRESHQIARGLARTRRGRWIAAANLLRNRYPIDTRNRITRRGYLVLRDSLSLSEPESLFLG